MEVAITVTVKAIELVIRHLERLQDENRQAKDFVGELRDVRAYVHDLRVLLRPDTEGAESHTLERIIVKCEDMQVFFGRVDAYLRDKYARKTPAKRRCAYRSFCAFSVELKERYRSIKASVDDARDTAMILASQSALRVAHLEAKENAQPPPARTIINDVSITHAIEFCRAAKGRFLAADRSVASLSRLRERTIAASTGETALEVLDKILVRLRNAQTTLDEVRDELTLAEERLTRSVEEQSHLKQRAHRLIVYHSAVATPSPRIDALKTPLDEFLSCL